VSERVLPAVQLDEHLRFSAAEVDDERAERMLTVELEAGETAVTQEKPELSLRVGL
jgi:hypothetical protein